MVCDGFENSVCMIFLFCFGHWHDYWFMSVMFAVLIVLSQLKVLQLKNLKTDIVSFGLCFLNRFSCLILVLVSMYS